MHAFQQDYGSHGFQSLTVNLQDDWPVILSYARIYSSLYLKDNGSVWAAYRQTGGIPLNYVIDTAGVIRYVAEGFSEPAVRAIVEQYLPDPIEHDVGVTRVVAPAGTIDSGSVVVPACSVYNYRNQTETYQVRMRIGTAYDQTATVTAHTPYTARYIEFPQWTATERGQVTARCSTELPTDDIHGNDLATRQVTVNVYDLAVTFIIAPVDSVDSGSVVVPMARVENLGTVADMAKVKLVIGGSYVDSVSLPLQAGRADTAVFDNWTALQLGQFPVSCTVRGRWEMVPENNVRTGSVKVIRSSGIEEGRGLALPFAFEVAPNPMTARVVARFSLPRPGRATVRVYSATGELVRTLCDGALAAGARTAAWDGRDARGRTVGHGVYYCRLEAGTTRAERKLVKTE